MNENSYPLDTIIEFAWSAGADKFWVNNAKDELRILRKYQNISSKPVAYAKTNEKGDLFDLRLTNNPFDNQKNIVPLYRYNNE